MYVRGNEIDVLCCVSVIFVILKRIGNVKKREEKCEEKCVEKCEEKCVRSTRSWTDSDHSPKQTESASFDNPLDEGTV